MKKYLIAVVLGLVLLLALATTVAMADNGPHGGFAANTDACAGCHRLHSAQVGSNELLVATDVEALCLSCHDAAGTGAYTDVTDGVYKAGGTEGVAGGSLFAGGFENAKMATAWSGKYAFDAAFNATSKVITSSHDQDLVPGGVLWGAGANNSVDTYLTLECTSCHDPHGNAGWDTSTTPDTRVASYRLLRWQPSGSNGFTAPAGTQNWSGGAFPVNDSTTPVSGWLVPDKYATLGTEWYTIGSQTINGTGPFALGDYNAGNGSLAYQPANGSGATQSYLDAAVNVPFFCAQCHDRYFNNSRMRNNTDASAYCGAPYGDMFANGVPLTVYAAVAGEHPEDPTRCEPVLSSTTGLLVSWGDNGGSGDTVYTYRHSSGDVRQSSDGTTAAGTLSGATSLSRSCVACHVAHGTSANEDPQPLNGVNAGTAGVGSLAGGSVLMRMDGRTICLRCHAPNYTIATSPSPVTYTSKDVSAGPALGGTQFVITGTGFSTATNPGVTGVRFTYTNGAGVAVTTNQTLRTLLSDVTGPSGTGRCFVDNVSTTSITCKSPEGYGVANVYIVTTGTVLTPAGTFTFTSPAAPSITSLDVVSGPVAGGTTVVITGTGFANSWAATDFKVSSVMFGAKSYALKTSGPNNGECVQTSTTSITCKTTTALAGAVDVKVTVSGGAFDTEVGAFTFVP